MTISMPQLGKALYRTLQDMDPPQTLPEAVLDKDPEEVTWADLAPTYGRFLHSVGGDHRGDQPIYVGQLPEVLRDHYNEDVAEEELEEQAAETEEREEQERKESEGEGGHAPTPPPAADPTDTQRIQEELARKAAEGNTQERDADTAKLENAALKTGEAVKAPAPAAVVGRPLSKKEKRAGKKAK